MQYCHRTPMAFVMRLDPAQAVIGLPLPTASDGCLETYSGSHSLIEKSWRAVVKWGE